MHRLRRMRTRMPSRRHQARHRARSGKMAGGEYRIRQELAEYHPEEGIPARREGLRGYGRQIREVFFSCSRDRRLTGIPVPLNPNLGDVAETAAWTVRTGRKS